MTPKYGTVKFDKSHTLYILELQDNQQIDLPD